MKIVITGSIAYDYIMFFPGDFRDYLLPESLDKVSLSFLVDEMTRQRGGVAPNIAYTLALLGERPIVVGTAGCDFAEYRQALDAVGVDTSGIRQIDDVFTASFFCTTDRRQCQIASFYIGAMAYARDLSLQDAAGGQADIVVISPNDLTAMSNYVHECKALGMDYLYDPSQQILRLEADTLREGVDSARLLVVNSYEYDMLRDKTGLTHQQITDMVQTVIVTCGKDGTDIYDGGREIHIPIVPPNSLADPTGVGDAFRAGLLKGLACGWPWEISGRVGTLASTYVLERRGPQTHAFSRAEFVARFRRHFDDGGLLDAMLD
jgi:adenosine kinase